MATVGGPADVVCSKQDIRTPGGRSGYGPDRGCDAEVSNRRRSGAKIRAPGDRTTDRHRRPDGGNLSRFGARGEADAPTAGAGGRVANGDPPVGRRIRA